jgi:hypothetical protein
MGRRGNVLDEELRAAGAEGKEEEEVPPNLLIAPRVLLRLPFLFGLSRLLVRLTHPGQ